MVNRAVSYGAWTSEATAKENQGTTKQESNKKIIS